MEPVSVSPESEFDLDDEIQMIKFGDANLPLPDDHVSEADLLIAKELASLSMKEREEVYFDVHGVSESVKETDEQIKQSLKQLDAELTQASSTAARAAYDLAMQRDSSYVQNDSFRLRFLRADRYDVKAAAQRLLRHFSIKLELFGESLLTQDITQDDLDSDDIGALHDCVFHPMPLKSTRERLVIFYKAPVSKYSVMAIMRKSFYACMSFSEDEDTQRNGCVMVSYLLGQTFSIREFGKRLELNQQYGKILSSTPLRVETLHMCMDSFVWRPFLAAFKLAMETFSRLRCREHFGDHDTVLFSLQTHGIPMEYVGATVVYSDSNKSYWLRRREFEQRMLQRRRDATAVSSPPLVVVEIPNSADVLLGRGKNTYSHVGNIRFRNLVVEHAGIYETAKNNKDKANISESIVRMIHMRRGRFLRDDGYGWVEVDTDTARKKVAHAFRTLRALMKPETDSGSSSMGESSHHERENTVVARKRSRGEEHA